MKQHISTEQLNQLSAKGKERLRYWWVPGEGQLWTLIENLPNGSYYHTQFGESLEKIKENEGMLPLLSIGQMIKFIFIHTEKVLVSELFTEEIPLRTICDELWEECKEILES